MTRLAFALVALALGAAWIAGDVGVRLAEGFVQAFPGVAG